MKTAIYGRFYLEQLDKDLSHTSIKVYIYLSSFMGKKSIHPSELVIGKAIGVKSMHKVSGAIAELMAKGMITRIRRINTSNLYTIITPDSKKAPFGLVNLALLPILKPNELKVLIVLLAKMRLTNTLKLDSLADITGITNKRTLNRALKSLEEQGIITIYKNEKSKCFLINADYKSRMKDIDTMIKDDKAYFESKKSKKSLEKV